MLNYVPSFVQLTDIKYLVYRRLCCAAVCWWCQTSGHERASELRYERGTTVELAWRRSSLLESEMSNWTPRWSAIQNQFSGRSSPALNRQTTRFRKSLFHHINEQSYNNNNKDQSNRWAHNDIRHSTLLVDILYHIRQMAARVTKLVLGVHLGPPFWGWVVNAKKSLLPFEHNAWTWQTDRQTDRPHRHQ